MSTEESNLISRLILHLERRIPRSLLRYGSVGVLQNGLFYLVALLLIAFGWQAWQAIVVLNPIAVAATFVANRSWSFAGRSHGPVAGRLWRYVLVYGLTYIYAVGFTWLLEYVGVPSWLAVPVTVAVAAAGMYIALNFWVFRDRGAQTSAADGRSLHP